MKRIYMIAFAMLLLSACGKEFLEVKQNQSEVIPSKINDYQAILDNSTVLMNIKSSNDLGFLGSDEFVVSDEVWQSLTVPYQKNGYIWAQDVYEKQPGRDWNDAYQRILHTNIVLDGIEKIKPASTEVEEWNNVKGSALFFRSFNFYQLAQLFCKPYDAATSVTSPGLPLRLEADITLKSTRATLEATYQQIIMDIKTAIELLPGDPMVKTRPSKSAGYALLARVYLLMDNYTEALAYAELCLDHNHELIDFNLIDVDRDTYNTFDLIQDHNPEMIFWNSASNMLPIAYGRFNAAPQLLESYLDNDLRKKAYFRSYLNTVIFKGSYTNGIFFTGLATDEILLIRAECYARTKEISKALDDLNYLLKNRYDQSFTPLASADPDEVLEWIIGERRKELVLRGTRWEDLRRLNKDIRFARSLAKTVNGLQYELAPGSLKYTWPIPDDVIEQSGMEQNPR